MRDALMERCLDGWFMLNYTSATPLYDIYTEQTCYCYQLSLS
jgi:hypothetical protein